MRGVDKELGAQIRKATRTIAEGEWRAELAKKATDPLQREVLVATARVAVGDQNVTLKAGQLSKKLSNGTPDLTPAVEFGANRSVTVQQASRSGSIYERHSRVQLRPRNRTGYVAYPAAAEIIPRIAALWVSTTVRTIHEAIESV
jgi:hypothetical protein